MRLISQRTENKETRTEYTVNRKLERDDESWLEYRPHADGKDGDTVAAPDPAAGATIEDPDDPGDEEPVETVEQPERGSEGRQPGDEALADAVRRALQEDALTTGATILVEVKHGVVHLDGRVGYLQDAEAAEAVASRVPGVRYVEDDLDVKSMCDEQ
jgi:hypothetical protein